MSHSRRLTVIGIICALLLIPIIFYFKYFPIIINSLITNCFIASLIIILILLFSYGSFFIKRLRDVCFIMPQAIIFVFISMALPNLRLSFPPLHDPYYHFVTTMNIAEYGSLDPILQGWYPQIDMQLHWSNMHLITTGLSYSTNLDLMQIFRFQEPLLGILILLGTFILAKRITGKNNVAFLSALLASFSPTLLFYLSEYHPQGLAFIFFIFLLYCFIGYTTSKNLVFGILTIIFVLTCTLTHHFSSLFLALLIIAYLLVIFIISHLPFLKNKLTNILTNLKRDYLLFGIMAIVMLSYHFFVYSRFSSEMLIILSSGAPFSQLISTGPNVPIFYTLLSSVKWFLLILAMIYIFYVFKTRNKNEFRCAILLGCIIIAGFIGTFIVYSPTDRMIGFFMPLAALFASLAIFKIKDYKFKTIKRRLPVFILVLIVSMPMISGFFGSQSPAYFFHDSQIDTYYWYSNRLPNMDEYKFSGQWTGEYIPKNATIGTEFDTKIIPFYYGKHPLSYIYNIDSINNFNYFLVNPSIPYANKGYEKKFFGNYMDILYDNGELNFFYYLKT